MVRLLAAVLLTSASGLVSESESLLQVANMGVSQDDSEWLFSAKTQGLVQTDVSWGASSPTKERTSAVSKAADLVAEKTGATAKSYYGWALAAERARENDEKVSAAKSQAQEAKEAAETAASGLEKPTATERKAAYLESDEKNKAQTQAFSRWQSLQNTGKVHAEKAAAFFQEAQDALREETEAIAQDAGRSATAKARIQAMVNKLIAKEDETVKQVEEDETAESESDVEESNATVELDDSSEVQSDSESEALSKVRDEAKLYLSKELKVGKMFQRKAKAIVAWAEAAEKATQSQSDMAAVQARISGADKEQKEATLLQAAADALAAGGADVNSELSAALKQARQDARLVTIAERRVGEAEEAAEEAMKEAIEQGHVLRERVAGVVAKTESADEEE